MTTKRAGPSITLRQLQVAVGVVSFIISITPFTFGRWAFGTYVKEEIRAGIVLHNDDPLAHARVFQDLVHANIAASKEQRDSIEGKIDKLATQIQQLREDVAVIKATSAVKQR